ncbi:hypothetical protein TNCV_4217721 [Trichonephila clavipes]|nr:hypothetical protein TNCV_4217721 [Trichonephila clavipes]
MPSNSSNTLSHFKYLQKAIPSSIHQVASTKQASREKGGRVFSTISTVGVRINSALDQTNDNNKPGPVYVRSASYQDTLRVKGATGYARKKREKPESPKLRDERHHSLPPERRKTSSSLESLHGNIVDWPPYNSSELPTLKEK